MVTDFATDGVMSKADSDKYSIGWTAGSFNWLIRAAGFNYKVR